MYIITQALRSTLDARGFNQTRIIVGDGDWDPASYIAKNPDFSKYVDGIGYEFYYMKLLNFSGYP